MSDHTPISVLCYGDSNTYGYHPVTCGRYPRDIRWTGRLQNLLGEDYYVIEEGCNGRTSTFKEPGAEWKNGLDYLKPCMNSHKPVDILVLMLGTNDLKEYFHASAKDIAESVEKIVKEANTFSKAKGFETTIILVSPIHVSAEIIFGGFGSEFAHSAATRSREFSKYYKEVAERNGCVFFDAAKFVEPSKEDSLHMNEEGHKKFAEALRKVILGL
ncbi:MAG: SGNH/GDSL hydrolase family protein [Dorea sp.]|nr:SGNH/GDSL hydrolase family protein [Dorea sp.]